MAELKACPACGSDNILIRGGVLNHYVECMESSCTMVGPVRKGAVAARDAWNALPRTDYRALAQQLAVALGDVKRELGQPGELATLIMADVALAAAKEAGIVPEVKA